MSLTIKNIMTAQIDPNNALRRRYLQACLPVVIVLASFANAAAAGVTGHVELDAHLIPAGVQARAVQFDLDVRSVVSLAVQLRRFNLGFQGVFGSAGLEAATSHASTTLGALSVLDELVFAVPLYNTGASSPILANELHPTHDGSGQRNRAAFAQHRLTLTTSISGISFSNLVLFEDVDFPNPLTYVNPVYHPHGVDGVLDLGHKGLANQTPSLGFGDVFSVQWQSVGGITLTSTTGVCARRAQNGPQNVPWRKSADPACSAQAFGSNGLPSSHRLLLDFATLKLDNVSLAGVGLVAALRFEASTPLRLVVKGSLPALGRALATFEGNRLTTLRLKRFQLGVQFKAIKATLLDVDGDLKFDWLSEKLCLVLNPLRTPLQLTLSGVQLAGVGWAFAKATFTLKKVGFTLKSATTFERNGVGALGWRSSDLRLSVAAPVGFQFKATVRPTGLLQIEFLAKVAF